MVDFLLGATLAVVVCILLATIFLGRMTFRG